VPLPVKQAVRIVCLPPRPPQSRLRSAALETVKGRPGATCAELSTFPVLPSVLLLLLLRSAPLRLQNVHRALQDVERGRTPLDESVPRLVAGLREELDSLGPRWWVLTPDDEDDPDLLTPPPSFERSKLIDEVIPPPKGPTHQPMQREQPPNTLSPPASALSTADSSPCPRFRLSRLARTRDRRHESTPHTTFPSVSCQ